MKENVGTGKCSFCLVILFSIVIIISLISPLYGQTPTPPKISNKPKTQTENTKKETKTSQSISENFSISGTFKITPQGNMEPSYNTNKHDDKATDDKAIQGWLIITFTGVIAVATLLQFWALLRQSKWMHKTLEITRQTAESARIQAETMRQEFSLKHRSKIHVREVIGTNLGDPFPADNFPEGKLDIVNVGGSAAEIISIGCWFEFGYGKELPIERPDQTEVAKPIGPSPVHLGSGQSFTHPFTDCRKPIKDIIGFDVVRRGKGDYTLYAIGYVKYNDTTGDSRHTTFFRKYGLPKDQIGGSKKDRKFLRMDDPRYDYEE